MNFSNFFFGLEFCSTHNKQKKNIFNAFNAKISLVFISVLTSAYFQIIAVQRSYLDYTTKLC